MKQKIFLKLNLCYYGMLALLLVVGSLSYALITKGIFAPIDTLSTAGRVWQYVVMMDALLTIPFGLWWHHRRCAQFARIEDEQERLQAWAKSAALRIVLVSNSMIPGIIAFYIMGCYQSMLWLSAIAAIGWYFTKPTERKYRLETQPKPDNAETY